MILKRAPCPWWPASYVPPQLSDASISRTEKQPERANELLLNFLLGWNG